MQAYYVEYTVKDKKYTTHIDAKNWDSVKKKLGRKHGYKTGRMIKITNGWVIGYY